MNRIQLIGRLGRDPESGTGPTGTHAVFTLATNEHWTDRASGEAVEHTEWHRLVCFDRLADIALEFLVKGSEVYVEGRLRGTRWTDQENRVHRGTEVRIDELKMLRRAPRADPFLLAAEGMASIERVLQDVAAGLRSDVSLVDVAGMLRLIRNSLVGGDDAVGSDAAGAHRDAA
jgi:single-strand DNA-binding protein